MRKKWLSALLALCMLGTLAMAEPRVSEVKTEVGENYVIYPQLEGLEDEAVQRRINDQIVAASGVTEHLITLVSIGQNPWTLRVDGEASLWREDTLSVLISARGKLPGERDGHRYTALCFDLRTGDRLPLEDVFTDVDEAVARMEAIALESLSEELNGYLEASDLTPLPRDAFTLDERGITFWYPSDQFRLLSGYAGAVQFWYEELDGLWKRPETEPLTGAEILSGVRKSVEAGALPKVPAQMGQPVRELTEAYRLLREPDAFPGGRYYVLEDPAFRGVLIISDALDDGSSVVEGIQLKRGGLCGLRIGTTSQEDWRGALGDPDEEIQMTQSMAYDYNLPEGQCDVYHFGTNELRLYAGETGVLSAIQLCK